MKAYVQFTTANYERTKVQDLCGSDGVFILDGRNTLNTWKADAIERAYRLRKVSQIDGYKIIVSDRFTNDNSKTVFEWIRSGALIQ